MSSFRLIPRLDVKGPNLIKGIQLEGLRVVGKPYDFAKLYYEQGADEILYIDNVASLYSRNSLVELVEKTASNVFVPITVCGGIRSIDDVVLLLRSGADKVGVNTAAILRPGFITDIANRFGSQCCVVSIEAKKTEQGLYEVLYNNGREHTKKNLIDWIKEVESLGAGEILLTSVDKDGTRRGFDIELAKLVVNVVNIPVVLSGGFGKNEELGDLWKVAPLSGVAMGAALHWKNTDIRSLRHYAKAEKIPVRDLP
jgi:cyclase